MSNNTNNFINSFVKSFLVSYGVSYALTKWANSDKDSADRQGRTGTERCSRPYCKDNLNRNKF